MPAFVAERNYTRGATSACIKATQSSASQRLLTRNPLCITISRPRAPPSSPFQVELGRKRALQQVFRRNVVDANSTRCFYESNRVCSTSWLASCATAVPIPDFTCAAMRGTGTSLTVASLDAEGDRARENCASDACAPAGCSERWQILCARVVRGSKSHRTVARILAPKPFSRLSI